VNNIDGLVEMGVARKFACAVLNTIGEILHHTFGSADPLSDISNVSSNM
jgi:hypothetical protein